MKVLFIPLLILLLQLGCARKENPSNPVGDNLSPSVVETEIPKKDEYAFGALCAESLASKNKKVMTDKKHTLIHNNVLYCFKTRKAKKKFEKNLEANVQKAQQNFDDMERRSNFNKDL